MKVTLTKLDVARRQLEAAIKMFFNEEDRLAVHTLAAASLNVLIDLTRYSKIRNKSIRDELLDIVREDKKKWLLERLRASENFMKHADRDPAASHIFDPDFTNIFLIDAVRCYGQLTQQQTPLMEAYFAWYLIENPHIFILPERFRQIVEFTSRLQEGIPKRVILECILLPQTSEIRSS